MCGIFGYIWWIDVQDKLISWLKLLEYRWYDSSGLYEIDRDWKSYFQRVVWKVSNLADAVSENKNKYFLWIAHTRWATHGWVSVENTHPHFSNNSRFFIVHNWIIENFLDLKKDLIDKWYEFYSQTDSEVVANLIQDNFEKNILTTIKKVTKILKWAYALEIVDKENPNFIIWVKKSSPLVIWIWKDWNYLSSDPNALRWFCENFISLNDEEIVVLKDNSYNVYSFDFHEKDKKLLKFEKYNSEQDKWDFKHFMLKEIFEIPQTFENAIAWRIDFKNKEITSRTLDKLLLKNFERIEIISSWTSYNAWLLASYYFERLWNIPTQCHVSTEFKYKTHFIDKKTLYIFISQSWETADTLECLKLVNAKWWFSFGIVNVVSSSISQLTNMWLYTHSWIEVWVASTKAFIWQIAVLLIMSLKLWLKNNINYSLYEWILNSMSTLNSDLKSVLSDTANIKSIAEDYSIYKNMFFLWRNLLFPIALEWSLKLKEITYHHTEAYSAWELKHGPLSLVDENFPSILINPENSLYEKNISTLQEVQARKGRVLWIITEHDRHAELYDDKIFIPRQHEILTPFLLATVLNLFAYYTADYLWKEIDKPRNLAKSVTVE